MIHLPPGAVLVLQDEAPEKVERKPGTIILSVDEIDAKPMKPNSGKIVFACEEFSTYIGDTMIFRPSYGEIILIEDVEYIHFRDFNSSMFYVESN